nr:U32 family peptidase [Streptomyces sp. HP-A2021]
MSFCPANCRPGKEIRQNVPDPDRSSFTALCIAYSGRCLLSGYINK